MSATAGDASRADNNGCRLRTEDGRRDRNVTTARADVSGEGDDTMQMDETIHAAAGRIKGDEEMTSTTDARVTVESITLLLTRNLLIRMHISV
jgi:hypothetical protein